MCASYMKYMLAIQALVQDLGLELTSSQCKINLFGVLIVRVQYYLGNLKSDPYVENYPYRYYGPEVLVQRLLQGQSIYCASLY